MLVGDLELEQLTLRALGDIDVSDSLRVAGETPIAPLPELLGTEVGGLAARGFDSDLRVEVFALGGGSFTGGVEGQPFAFNELYKLTLRPDEDGNYVPDGGWHLIADYADTIEGMPNNGVVPLVGLASLGGGLYSVDASGLFTNFNSGDRGASGCLLDMYVDIVSLEVPASGGSASFHTNTRVPINPFAADVFGTGSQYFALPSALDGSNERGTIFAAISGLDVSEFGAQTVVDRITDMGWAQQFFDGLPQFEQTFGFFEIDPRTQYLARTIYYGSGPGASDNPNLYIYQPGFEPLAFDGLAYEDGKLVLTGRGQYYHGAADAFSTGRYFLTIDPDTGEVEDFQPEVSGSGGLGRPILGLAGSNYGNAHASLTLAPQSPGFDDVTIDPVFAKLAYSNQAIGSFPVRDNTSVIEVATPLSALYTMHIVDTALDPEAAARSSALDRIPQVLVDHVEQTGGIGSATFDLRDPLPPGHPLSGEKSDRGLDVRSVGLTEVSGGFSGGGDEIFTTLGNRDLREFDTTDLRDDSLPDYLFDGFVEGGLTTRESSGVVQDRLLYGGYTDVEVTNGVSSEIVVAYNEVYEIDTENSEPSWTLLGKFLPPVDGRMDSGGDFWAGGDAYMGGEWPLLTGLSALDDDDYAISHDARIFRLHYPNPGQSGGSYEGTLETVADLRWDRGGALATAESRGSLFAVGQFEGTDLPVRQGAFASLSDMVVYELDPRNSFVKDTWWGFNGDFEAGLATSWGTFDSWQGPRPTEVISLDGAAWVSGGDSGTLVISGDFMFDVDGDGVQSRAKGKGKRTKHHNISRDFSDHAFLSINIAADGSTRNPYLMRIDFNDGTGYSDSGWIGLASRADDTSASAPGPAHLGAPTGDVDFDTLGVNFSKISYTQDALRTGALQQVFASEFAKSVPGFTKQELLSNPLLEQALQQFVGQENGIAQASAFLQNALGSNAIAQTGGAAEAGVPNVGPDQTKKHGKKVNKKTGKVTSKERRLALEQLRREHNAPRNNKAKFRGS